jgi:lysophospholipase L1-like esterase
VHGRHSSLAGIGLAAAALLTSTCSSPTAPQTTIVIPPATMATPAWPRLSVTTILAFGDSLTAGEVPAVGEFSFRPRYYEPDNSYPTDLITLLGQRYTGQGASGFDVYTVDLATNSTTCTPDPQRPATSGILVINAGCGGARAGDPVTKGRLDDALRDYHPDLVLLLEGTNDLDSANPASVTAGVRGIQALVADAQQSGARVMVGTIPPQIAADLTHGGSP